MALTFPLALTDFFAGLPIQTIEPDLDEALDYSETGGGELLTADLGPRLWSASVTLRLGEYGEMENIRAKLDTLRYAGRSLLVHAIPSIGPQADPQGVILGASDVRLAAVAGNNRDVTLSGLPAGYVLKGGDCFSFMYGSNPVRYAMHRIVANADVVANGSGVAVVESSSFIRPGYVINSAVKLIKPTFKAVIVPGSVRAGTTGGTKTTGISFMLRQTLR